MILFDDGVVLLTQGLDALDDFSGSSGSEALDECLVLVGDDTALAFVSLALYHNEETSYLQLP